jgi:diguanylate cyclase (GGDEF)-like protein
MPEAPADESRNSARRQFLRMAILIGWGAVLAVQTGATISNPGVANIVAEVGFILLFLLVNLQLVLMGWIGHRSWRSVTSRLHGTAYLSEALDLPNRNYVLAELRREMPRSRSQEAPFVLIQLSLDNIAEVRERRGDEFAQRAVKALGETLKRLTRSSDFLAHLGEARFCVMLVECTVEQSGIYLRRVPGTIAVSDGRSMFDIPVVARVHEYDGEAMYATDVLREVEEAQPLRRQEPVRSNSFVA